MTVPWGTIITWPNGQNVTRVKNKPDKVDLSGLLKHAVSFRGSLHLFPAHKKLHSKRNPPFFYQWAFFLRELKFFFSLKDGEWLKYFSLFLRRVPIS